jgi:hypothetical protein
MGLPPLQIVVEKEARQAAYAAPTFSKKSAWGHSVIFKIAA